MERDEAVLREKMLEAKVHELEEEAETKAHSKEDKARHVKLMEVHCITRVFFILSHEKRPDNNRLGFLNTSVNLRYECLS